MRPGVDVNPALQVKRLSYHYPDGTAALRQVDFTLAQGARVGLIGPNGAGKSTLLWHLNGLLPDSPGKTPAVWIDGQPLTEKNLPEMRRRVGLMFQDANDQLFCATVAEDVAFGPRQLRLSPQEVQQRVQRSLQQVGLSGFEKRPPHHLSVGEKRRVCLAGVLACQPSILALDEPSSNLDPRGRRELIHLLAGLPQTQLIASHDLELIVELCQQVLLLDGGQIVAQGPTRSILNDEQLMLAHGLERPHVLRHAHPHNPSAEP